MAVTATLSGNITVTDNIAGDSSLSKVISQSFTGTFSNFIQSQQIGTSPTTLTLPGSPAQFVYLRNLASGTGQNLSVVWTAQGGSSVSVISLSPGGAIFLTETDTSGGITNLQVQASIAGTPVEYICVA